NSITTALGGTVVMNQDGTFTYTAPVRIHNDLISDQDSFVYKSSDGEDQSSWTTVNIDITDTNPVADFDFDVVDMGDSTSGNVLSNDTIIDSPNERLTAIEFNGTTYDSFDLNGNLTITTDSGILTINQDGSYNYTSTLFTTAGGSNGLADWSDLSITAFNGARTVVADNEFFIDGTTYLPTSNNILSLTGTGSLTVVDDVLGDGTDGIGIAEGSGNSTYLNGHPTNPEAILLNFGNDISSADVNFYSGTNSGVPFYWATYDSDGNFVDSGNGAISKPTFTLNIENTSSDPFQYVVFYGVDSSASSKVLITDVENIEYADLSPDVFNYTVMDADGNTDVSSLTINQVGIGDDVATVFEAGLSDGTDLTADTVVTGNILANDQGLSATTSITSVEGNSSIINGTITVTTALGQLVVYTEASASHNAGDYIYTLNDNSVAGDNVIDSFNYVVTDSSDNSTFDANLIVNVVDDAPVATSMVKNLQVDDSVFTTNLVIVLDSSGSMGTTRMQLAKDALKYMISGYDDIGNVNIQIIDFDSSVNESQWFTDDVSSANDFIDNVTSGGTTHYDDALNAVIDDFSKPAADQTLVYFLSDGNPYPGTNGVDDTVVYTDSLGVEHTGSSAWEKFVDENVDKAYGVGIGTNVDTDLGLNSIAYPGSAILVEDESELSTTLYDSINTGYVSGSVSVFDSDTSGIVLGADGGHIESITIDGTTYNYDPSTPEVTYTTALGASLTFNFETGAYYYGITLDDSNYGQVETFSLVAIDNDGDTVSSDFSVNLNFKADFDANVDTIITNSIVGDDLVIPDTALLANDTGSNSINSTFDAVGGAVTHNTTTTTFNTGGDFGTVASVINESTVLPGDTESNPLNNSLQTAYDLTDRSLYGQVSAADSSYLGDSTLPSVKYVGAIGDESDSDSDHDSDWLKVSLQKGEKIILDVDFGIGGNSDESTDTYLYIRNSDGDIIAQNDDAPNSSTGGLGSSSRYDSYLEYSAPENGEYYIQVTTYDAVNNNNDNEGTYDLWLSIDNSAIESSSFDYDIVGVSKTDSTTVDITYQTGDTVQGGSEDEILIGRDNANDTLIAGDGDDILIGTSGNDTFIGDAGADLFVFGNSSQGNNVIDDFNQGEGDTLIFSDLLISASDELSAHLTLDADSNGDTIITVTDNNTTVTLKDVKLDSLNIDTNNPLGDLMTSIKSDIEPDSI
ncbi:MAG: VWA domain-containing protein, partial [Gammaproteobacteria bacterium]|nr:VWA domain-containing protein [Gammaproteobacteria bacterium]